VLHRVVVSEATERQQQVHDARRHFPKPRFEFWQQVATFLQPAGFKAGVIRYHRAGGRQLVAELAHEFRAWVGRADGQKAKVFWLGVRRTDDVQGILKGYLLVGPDAVKQRDGRADGLEIQVANRILKLAEKSRECWTVDVRFAREQGGPLDSLISGERNIGWNVRQLLDALIEQLETKLPAPV